MVCQDNQTRLFMLEFHNKCNCLKANTTCVSSPTLGQENAVACYSTERSTGALVVLRGPLMCSGPAGKGGGVL